MAQLSLVVTPVRPTILSEAVLFPVYERANKVASVFVSLSTVPVLLVVLPSSLIHRP